MYYVETRADNSGYTNHRAICLVVIGYNKLEPIHEEHIEDTLFDILLEAV
jgi:hypothetical protein